MFEYSQTSGSLTHDGKPLGVCYSGHNNGVENGVNNPALQSVAMVGPIPAGVYTIGEPFHHPTCGPDAMRLTAAEGTETFGRGGFLMHGDNSKGNESASEGCIIAAHTIRLYVAQQVAAGDNQLTVTA